MKKRYVVLTTLGAVLVAAVACNPSTPSAPAAPSTAQAAPVTTAPAPPPTETPPATEEPAGPRSSFGNGEWLVGPGAEVLPGTYRSPGPVESAFKLCSVQTDPAPKDSLGWETSADGPVRIDLIAGQTVDASGCEEFVKVS